MAVNLINVHVWKIRIIFRWVRLVGVKFEQSKLLKYSSNFYHNFELIKYYQTNDSQNVQHKLATISFATRSIPKSNEDWDRDSSWSRYARARADSFTGSWWWWVRLVLGLFYRVHIEALEEGDQVTNYKISGLGFSVEEPDITTKFHDFLLIMYKNTREKPIFRYTTMVIEQLKAPIRGFCKLTNYQKRQWAKRFDSWPPQLFGSR